MKIVCDACTLINLAAGGVLPLFQANGIEIACGEICLDEATAGGPFSEDIQESVRRGFVERFPDDTLQVSQVEFAMSSWKLGAGESECILLVESAGDWVAASDDNRARNIASDKFGKERVLGSIGLLRRLVLIGAISIEDAVACHQLMRDNGAFLPPADSKYYLH